MEKSTNETNGDKILVIDDDVKFFGLLKDYLELRGFRLEGAHTGTDGVKKLAAGDFEAVILDVMLPEIDGFEVLKQIRRISAVPVLMLTALGDEADRIIGLETGADDYLPKTFSTRELLARLRSVIRRSQMTAAHGKTEAEKIRVGEIAVNTATREVSKNGEFIGLTALEYDLLVCLMRAAGAILSRDTLLDEIAGRNYDVFDRSIDVHVSSLRRKLDDDSKNPRYIKTVRSAGYLFVRNEPQTTGEN